MDEDAVPVVPAAAEATGRAAAVRPTFRPPLGHGSRPRGREAFDSPRDVQFWPIGPCISGFAAAVGGVMGDACYVYDGDEWTPTLSLHFGLGAGAGLSADVQVTSPSDVCEEAWSIAATGAYMIVGGGLGASFGESGTSATAQTGLGPGLGGMVGLGGTGPLRSC